MKKKKRFKKNFILISAVFIFGLLFAYGSRLIHFYRLENKVTSDGEVAGNYLSDILENTINVSDINGGLYIDQNAYMFKYDATENYLWYSGQLWRILRINEDKSIKIITANSISLVHPKYGESKYINDFLNDFYGNLDQEYLVKFSSCNDKIEDIKNIKCTNYEGFNIALLDMYTYNQTGNQKSFLNNGESFWLSNTDANGNYFYITNDKTVAVGSENVAHSVRPIVTLKANINLISGEGTKEDPYIIKSNENETLSDAVIGEYITYNDELWRILSKTNESISAIKLECIKENKECLKYKFGSNINYLNSSIYKYLNNTYFNKLENNDFLVKGTFYVGNYKDYNYKALMENKIEAYIGLPKVADYYIDNNFSSYLITPNTIETIYTLNELGNYYLVNPTSENEIYPVINFDKNLKITGDGTLDNPYKLSR